MTTARRPTLRPLVAGLLVASVVCGVALGPVGIPFTGVFATTSCGATVVDHADGDANTPERKRAFLESYAPLAAVPAIRDKRFFVLPYAALVESPRNPAG